MDYFKLVDVAKSKGITELEVACSRVHSTSIETFNGKVDKSETSDITCYSIRGVYNNQIATVYSEDGSDDLIETIVSKIIETCSLLTKNEPFFIYGGSKEYPLIEEKKNDFNDFSLLDKTKICLDLEAAIKNRSEFVKNTSANYSEEYSEYSIRNTNGLNLYRKGAEAMVLGEAVCEKNNDVKTSYDYVITKQLKNVDIPNLVANIVDRTIKTFDADAIKSGSYKVVLENKVVCSILKAFATIFSAKSALKNLSFLANSLGEKVFGENINIIDDPLNDLAPNQFGFDDEGVACYTKPIIKNGVLTTFLHNLTTAEMMKVSSTGNGFKASPSQAVGIAPANLYLEKGNFTKDELLAKASDGVLITEVTGLHAGLNTISGAFNLQAKGFVIENGVITKPVTLIIISGNIKDVLNSVTGIANDFVYRQGVGSASILVENINISGK